VKIARGWLQCGFLLCLSALVGLSVTANSLAQTPDQSSSVAGGWTLDRDLSDRSTDPTQQGNQPQQGNPDDGARRGRRGGGRGGGGFGGGGRGGNGAGGSAGRANPEDAARIREAMADLTNPPEHLVIVEAGSMIVLTGPDGRTLRLSPDGKKIKDENTGIERKTTWVGGKLVSEITGLGPTKITQSYAVDADHHQLRIVEEFDGGRGGGQGRTVTHVYNADTR
jgi:hypothetical protein